MQHSVFEYWKAKGTELLNLGVNDYSQELSAIEDWFLNNWSDPISLDIHDALGQAEHFSILMFQLLGVLEEGSIRTIESIQPGIKAECQSAEMVIQTMLTLSQEVKSYNDVYSGSSTFADGTTNVGVYVVRFKDGRAMYTPYRHYYSSWGENTITLRPDATIYLAAGKFATSGRDVKYEPSLAIPEAAELTNELYTDNPTLQQLIESTNNIELMNGAVYIRVIDNEVCCGICSWVVVVESSANMLLRITGFGITLGVL